MVLNAWGNNEGKGEKEKSYNLCEMEKLKEKSFGTQDSSGEV